jgi:hypothetical protein
MLMSSMRISIQAGTTWFSRQLRRLERGSSPSAISSSRPQYRRARPRAVHMNIERCRGRCIVWVIWDRQPDGLIEVRRILFYGASPSKPMPPIQGVYVRRPGRQGRRRATKKKASTQFMDVADFPELARKLFP